MHCRAISKYRSEVEKLATTGPSCLRALPRQARSRDRQHHEDLTPAEQGVRPIRDHIGQTAGDILIGSGMVSNMQVQTPSTR